MPKKEGESLRLYLRKVKITQADLSMKTGLSRSTILNYLKMDELPLDFKRMLTDINIQYTNVQSAEVDVKSNNEAMRQEILYLKREIDLKDKLIQARDEMIEMLRLTINQTAKQRGA